MKIAFNKIEADEVILKTKEQDLKVLSEEVGKLKSKIRNGKSLLAMEIANCGGKLVFNCGNHVLILKSKRVEKIVGAPEHKGYILIVEKEKFS